MRGCLVTLALLLLITSGFIAGAASGQSVVMIASFIASYPVWLIGGWSLRGVFNGRRIALVEVERRTIPTSQRRQRLQQQESSDRALQETL